MVNVGVIGLGEIGLANLKYCMEKDLDIDIYACDIDIDRVWKALAETWLRVDHVFEDVSEMPCMDVYLICVPSSVTILEDVVQKITTNYCATNPLICIESTVPIGLSRYLWYHYIESTGMHLVHCPERYSHSDPQHRGVNRLRVLGGIDDVSLEQGLKFYTEILDMEVRPVTSIETAEYIKVMENAYRGVIITTAQEMKMMADRLDIDFSEVSREMEKVPTRFFVAEPRTGVRGHCLPMAMRWASDYPTNQIFKTALDSNEHFKRYIKKEQSQ